MDKIFINVFYIAINSADFMTNFVYNIDSVKYSFENVFGFNIDW